MRDRLATRDLLSLARAIAQPADRLAWLSVLHAPWCGFGLADLLTIADAAAGRTVVEAMASPDAVRQLPTDSSARMARLLRAVAPALAARGHASFTARVRGAWLALGGPACTDSPLDRDGADRVFALLAQHERGGDLPDFETFLAAAGRLFAEARDAGSSRVQVMTLHKAKGLQFGAVILPGLDLRAGRGGSPLLRWKIRERDGQRTLMLAPVRARIGARAETDPVYAWLGALDAAEDTAELGRLLYVGATRAKRRLHLVAVAEVDTKAVSDESRGWRRPRHGSAAERLWDALDAIMPPFAAQDRSGDHRRRRAARFGAVAPAERMADARTAGTTACRATGERDRRAGVRLGRGNRRRDRHRIASPARANGGRGTHRLERSAIARRATRASSPNLAAKVSSRIGARHAAQRVVDIVTRTLNDPRGRWLFDPAHADAHSEWALAGEDEGRVAHVVLDRSFVADGYRYIVDFKTGAHLGGDEGAFLEQEFERYRPQLARYARIVRALDSRPVRIALYHPLVDGRMAGGDIGRYAKIDGFPERIPQRREIALFAPLALLRVRVKRDLTSAPADRSR